MKALDIEDIKRSIDAWEDDGGGPLCKEDLQRLVEFAQDIRNSIA
jgi:hypothetical protein